MPWSSGVVRSRGRPDAEYGRIHDAGARSLGMLIAGRNDARASVAGTVTNRGLPPDCRKPNLGSMKPFPLFRPFFLTAPVTWVAACSDPTAPSFATVIADFVDVEDGAQSTTVTTEVIVANATGGTLHFNPCATSLERDMGAGTWLPVGGATCLTIGYMNPFDGMVSIPPRGYRRVTQYLYLSQPIRDLDGTNRFRVRTMVIADFPGSWWSSAPVPSLATDVVTSNEFVIDLP